MTPTCSIYFAGALFSNKDLIGNALLADAIHNVSGERYQCILPQNREQRETTSEAIRNQDLYICASCDAGLFHFDGTELDSGTVVEYMLAKFLDIPSVIVRSDFRRSGDDDKFPWNLMLSHYPRTKVVTVDAMADYQKPFLESAVPEDQLIDCAKAGLKASFAFSNSLAHKIVNAFDEVCSEKPILKDELLQAVYNWIRLFPGAGFDKLLGAGELEKIIERRKCREQNKL